MDWLGSLAATMLFFLTGTTLVAFITVQILKRKK